jgi:hypothetical protein
MKRYPQWKIDLFKNRNVDRCSCRAGILGVTSDRTSPNCPLHGDSASERIFAYEKAESLLPEDE